ncbi:MAG TPA: hypothetical protein VGK41_00250 [Solirubrobacterales bacterium]
MADDPLGFKKYPADARRRNLEKGNAVRRQNKKLRELVRAGELDPYGLLAGDNSEWEPVVQRSKVSSVLLMIPGIGEVTRDELIEELSIQRSDRFNALSYERRAALAQLVRTVLEPGTELKVPRT